MEFEKRKKATLTTMSSPEPDKSPKGDIDTPIVPLLKTLNSHPSYFTTRSCSRRISILSTPTPTATTTTVKKKAKDRSNLKTNCKYETLNYLKDSENSTVEFPPSLAAVSAAEATDGGHNANLLQR
ncbi:hypothetical protein LXL04_033001 [Taraxacum kok-saghyz]